MTTTPRGWLALAPISRLLNWISIRRFPPWTVTDGTVLGIGFLAQVCSSRRLTHQTPYGYMDPKPTTQSNDLIMTAAMLVTVIGILAATLWLFCSWRKERSDEPANVPDAKEEEDEQEEAES